MHVVESTPRRLVFTWNWGTTPDRVSRVTYALSADGPGRTTLTLTHERLYDREVRDQHTHGWTGSLVKLEAWLARRGER